jgi:hypothetical protein
MTCRSPTPRTEAATSTGDDVRPQRRLARPGFRAARTINGWAITAAGAALQYAELRGTF